MSLQPFMKWPGGKRWFIHQHSDVLPQTYRRYIEPFLGGGSVFFHLQPEQAILGDTNAELIDLFRMVAWRRKTLEQMLQEHQQNHGKRHYYRVRSAVPDDPVERAARTLYLNRTCFNGMYRVNREGEFNVPKGVKDTILLAQDDFTSAAKLLRRAKIVVSDFQPLIDRARRNDLVFADPPYIVGHNNNGFVKYNELLFKWDDQIRLAEALRKAQERGVKVVSTNAAHAQIERLYPTSRFAIRRVERFSSISGDANGRCQFQEIIIMSK